MSCGTVRLRRSAPFRLVHARSRSFRLVSVVAGPETADWESHGRSGERGAPLTSTGAAQRRKTTHGAEKRRTAAAAGTGETQGRFMGRRERPPAGGVKSSSTGGGQVAGGSRAGRGRVVVGRRVVSRGCLEEAAVCWSAGRGLYPVRALTPHVAPVDPARRPAPGFTHNSVSHDGGASSGSAGHY